MLATAFAHDFQRTKTDFVQLGRNELDFDSPEFAAQIGRLIAKPRALIINCVADTDVDGAESNQARARAVNCEAVRILAEHVKTIDGFLVHFSTDYVFSGEGSAPYPVDAPHAPQNEYGRSKSLGEGVLNECLDIQQYLLLRTSWVYAPWGKNFVRTIFELTSKKPELKVVGDQRGRPSSAEQIVRTTLELLEAQRSGVWHATDSGECSWFEFAVWIAECAKHSCQIAPCSSSEFPRPAKRPAYSVLDISQTESAIGPRKNWKDEVSAVVSVLRSPSKQPS